MSEFEHLIGFDFKDLTEAQYKKILSLISTETGKEKMAYYMLTLLKVQAEMYKQNLQIISLLTQIRDKI